MVSKGQRVAVVAGLRTPFAKQWTAYRELSALDLANLLVSELLQRTGLDPGEIEKRFSRPQAVVDCAGQKIWLYDKPVDFRPD